ncbi:MAG: hypothetical protein VB062_02505 [Christensenella sp.]|nr:hypothetical protein [Christensenella sp.]
MKKIVTTVIAILLIFAFASCKKVADTAAQQSAVPAAPTSPQQAAELPNPIVEVEDSTDFDPLGFIITPHQQAESVSYSIISNTIAQIIFTLDGETFTYRAAKTTEDISGVYETFDPLPQSLDLAGPGFTVTVQVQTINGGADGALAKWSFEDVQYTFYTPDKTDFDSLTDVLLPIIYVDLPLATCCG